MHPNYDYLSVNGTNWKLASFQLTEELHWDLGNVQTEVISLVPPKGSSQVFISAEAFWSDDHFEKNQKVMLLIERKTGREGTRRVAFIGTEAFCRPFFNDRGLLEAVECIQGMVSLPPEAQLTAYSHICHGVHNSGQKNYYGNINNLDLADLRRLFNVVSKTLLSEQREACERWLASPGLNHGREKLAGLLSVRPAPAYGRPEITYESVMRVFDEEIVGYHEWKQKLALDLVNIVQKQGRGINVFLHGLPGTAKTAFGYAIARALNRPCQKINLGGVTSNLATIGCPSTYDNADFGKIFKFVSANGAEVVILLDEVDKLLQGADRGKNGNVLESFLDMLSPESPYLHDQYLDAVPIDLGQCIFVVTGNRVDNIPSEILSRMNYIIETKAFSEDILFKILQRNREKLAKQYELKSGWIKDDALRELLFFRKDFGARDAVENLKALAAGWKRTITAELVRERMMAIVDLDDPAVRFHMNEHCYPMKQKKKIMECFSRRICSSNLSDQEKRALDMQLDHLTKLVHDKNHVFDVDRYDQRLEKLYGLEAVKKQAAAEMYAASVNNCRPQPILLEGAPGTGKTSLVKIIGEASGRPCVFISLNGVTDHGFIKGYGPERVAAVAGKPISMMAEARTACALICFDEIDKLSVSCAEALLDFFSDSATFYDNFLGVEIDLSGAVLLATCNDASKIPPALRSRFVEIHVPGYSVEEKTAIAKHYLLPELTAGTRVTVNDDALHEVLAHHECDSGVRELKQDFHRVVKTVMLEQRHSTGGIRVTLEDVERILGDRPYIYTACAKPGSVNGLAVASGPIGIVSPIHVTLLRNGSRRVTGLAGEAVQECITLTETWLEDRYDIHLDTGFHIHFGPPGGVRKDGMSAGVAIACSMLSAVLGIDISDVALTGEFDGCYRVQKIGGAKLKVQAAQNAGLRAVYLPASNRSDIEVEQFHRIKIVFVNTIDEIIADLMPNAVVRAKTMEAMEKNKVAG